MQERIANKSEPWSFCDLPLEIRELIVKAIAIQKNKGWGSHAAVCKEWRAILEPFNFRKLNLHPSELNELVTIVPANTKNQRLVRHICLNIDLPTYDFDDILGHVLASPYASKIVLNTVSELCWVLHDWKPAGKLALELNAYSTSDTDCWFPNLHLESDNVDDPTNANIIPDVWKGGRPYHDPIHGWEHGRRSKRVPVTAMCNLFAPIYAPMLRSLKIVAVTDFIVRRQTRRFFAPYGFKHLLAALSQVESIWYEPWDSYTTPFMIESRKYRNDALSRALDLQLVPHLKNLVLFEDSYSFYRHFGEERRMYPGVRDNSLLSKTLATNAALMHNVAISFLVTAEQLLEHWYPQPLDWPFLETLTLTSPCLRPSCISGAESLLGRAARVVQHMKKLHTFVLWNGGWWNGGDWTIGAPEGGGKEENEEGTSVHQSNACAFLFRRFSRHTASITWRGNRQYTFPPLVIKDWRDCAAALGCDGLEVRHEHITDTFIRSHGDAIYHLRLPCPVITPESIWQIRREAHVVI